VNGAKGSNFRVILQIRQKRVGEYLASSSGGILRNCFGGGGIPEDCGGRLLAAKNQTRSRNSDKARFGAIADNENEKNTEGQITHTS